MAVENLSCSAEGATTNWILIAGDTKVIAVALPDNDTTSYIASGTTINTVQQFALSNPSASIASNATINSVTYYVRTLRGGTNNVNFTVTVVLGADTTASGTLTATNAWATLSGTLARPGGGSWSKADLTSSEIRIQNTQARTMYCTTLYLAIDYTNPPPYNYVNLERGTRGLIRGVVKSY